MTCRAFTYQPRELLPNQRLLFDEKLKSLGNSIRFFISCISGTTTNNGADDSTRACISYFIVHNDLITEDRIFEIFHDADLDPEMKKVGRKGTKSYNQSEIFGELKSILKVSVELSSIK